jgi:hypothetical protein
MVRKATRKKRSIAISQTQQKIMDRKHYGDEPSFKEGHKLTESEKLTAYNWYNYMCDRNDIRSYLNNYLKATGRTADIKKLKSVSDAWLPSTAAWIARLVERGCFVPATSHEFLETKLEETLARVEKPTKSKTKAAGPSIQDRIREKVGDFIGEIEEKIDTGEDFSMYEELTVAQFPSQLAKKVADYYRPEKDELVKLTAAGADADLREGYGYLSKEQRIELRDKFKKIVADADRYANNTKKAKAPRKKRVVPADKKVAKLNFLSEHNKLQLHSVNPTMIVGAQTLWVYNTKYKKLSVFHAQGPSGLDVKGSTIIGFDQKTSEMKTIGRSEKATLAKVLDGGKIILRRLMLEIKASGVTPTGRINKDTILLRVVK